MVGDLAGVNPNIGAWVGSGLGSHLSDDSSTLRRPFLSILKSIFKILVAAFSENPAFFEFISERNDIKVEEAKFALIPRERRILIGTASNERSVTFLKEEFVPLSINVENMNDRS